MHADPIFIIGLPACGKSTFGKALAKRLGRRFIDLDTYIENRFHTSIPELFSRRGEQGFRSLEAVMLRETGEFLDTIIATGGGAPCHSGNMEYMNSRGITVWLQASRGRILKRLLRNRRKRPMLQGLDPDALAERIDILLQQRAPFYSQAEIYFVTDHLENTPQINGSVSAFLREFYSY